jgi:hypothetical protein
MGSKVISNENDLIGGLDTKKNNELINLKINFPLFWSNFMRLVVLHGSCFDVLHKTKKLTCFVTPCQI